MQHMSHDDIVVGEQCVNEFRYVQRGLNFLRPMINKAARRDASEQHQIACALSNHHVEAATQRATAMMKGREGRGA
jgi:hypothetical protein